MPRVVLISLLVLSVLIWLGIKARQAKQTGVAAALFTAATIYALIMLLSFAGVIHGL